MSNTYLQFRVKEIVQSLVLIKYVKICITTIEFVITLSWIIVFNSLLIKKWDKCNINMFKTR